MLSKQNAELITLNEQHAKQNAELVTQNGKLTEQTAELHAVIASLKRSSAQVSLRTCVYPNMIEAVSNPFALWTQQAVGIPVFFMFQHRSWRSSLPGRSRS